jgi:hypothetical protein
MKNLTRKKISAASAISVARKRRDEQCAWLAAAGIPKFMIRVMQTPREHLSSGDTTFRPRHD